MVIILGLGEVGGGVEVYILDEDGQQPPVHARGACDHWPHHLELHPPHNTYSLLAIAERNRSCAMKCCAKRKRIVHHVIWGQALHCLVCM